MTALITHAKTMDHVWMESTITRVAAWQVIQGITARKVRSSSVIPVYFTVYLFEHFDRFSRLVFIAFNS